MPPKSKTVRKVTKPNNNKSSDTKPDKAKLEPTHPDQSKFDQAEDHIRRVRRIALSLPGASEKLSHGEPTFFAKKVFAMISNNHHNDGHLAVWMPAAPGVQASLINSDPKTYYYPPYVGKTGWVGIELDQIGDDELGARLTDAWR